MSGGRDPAIVPHPKQTGGGKLEPAPWRLVICVAAALLRFAVEVVYVLLCGDVSEVLHLGLLRGGLDERILESRLCSYFAAGIAPRLQRTRLVPFPAEPGL